MFFILKRTFYFLCIVALLFFTRAFWFDLFAEGTQLVQHSVSQLITNEDSTPPPLELFQPESQTFSVGNIEIGDNQQEVEAMYGTALNQTQNEYGTQWASYHQNYQNFMMVAYDQDNIVRGLFTNQELLASTLDIQIGTTKQTIRDLLGEPEESIHKGLYNYLINSEGEYDVYQIDNNFITFFYDLHDGDKLTAIQIIEQQLELHKNYLYANQTMELQTGFEGQLFDLTNASRVKRGLSALNWSDQAQETGRKHSKDMADNNYFDHINLQGQSPFDRMNEDQISYTLAGENLAYGQASSIFAHQGLLNSEGHRKNILNNGFENLGIGVSFNEENQPYFTELFYK